MIHKYRFKDKHIVLDINSGAVHVIDKIVFDILDTYEGHNKKEVFSLLQHVYSKEEITEALRELDYLQSQGLLFSDDTYITHRAIHQKEPVVKAICLHVAHDCNMNCKYCFGSQGSFEGCRELMSLDTGIAAIDYLIKNSGKRKNLEVDFFGGEPLMNFDVVKEIIAYGRKVETHNNKKIRFTITTNGILLDDEKISYINRNMENVILSIDGRSEVNDKMRRTWNDKGTYDLIINNYKKFIKERNDGLYYVRGTFTRENLDFSEDVKHLIQEGFKNISVEPVVANDNEDYAIKIEDVSTILDEYEKLSDYYIHNAKNNQLFEFFHFNIDLEQGPCVIKRISGCGAGTEYMAIAPNGDLYPCHQFVGDNDFRIGSVYDTHYSNRLFDVFNDMHIYNKEKCLNCWAKFYCSGGCHANAYHINKNMLEPYEIGCEMEKKRIECAIGIQAVLNY